MLTNAFKEFLYLLPFFHRHIHTIIFPFSWWMHFSFPPCSLPSTAPFNFTIIEALHATAFLEGINIWGGVLSFNMGQSEGLFLEGNNKNLKLIFYGNKPESWTRFVFRLFPVPLKPHRWAILTKRLTKEVGQGSKTDRPCRNRYNQHTPSFGG